MRLAGERALQFGERPVRLAALRDRARGQSLCHDLRRAGQVGHGIGVAWLGNQRRVDEAGKRVLYPAPLRNRTTVICQPQPA